MKGRKKSKGLQPTAAFAMPTAAQRVEYSAKDLLRTAAEADLERSGAVKKLAAQARKIVRGTKRKGLDAD